MKQPSSKPLTVRSILVVVGLIALNVVLILAYLYFIHYPIPHSAYASGDPGRLDAQKGHTGPIGGILSGLSASRTEALAFWR